MVEQAEQSQEVVVEQAEQSLDVVEESHQEEDEEETEEGAEAMVSPGCFFQPFSNRYTII